MLEDVSDRAKEVADYWGNHGEIVKYVEWKKAVRGYLATIRFADHPAYQDVIKELKKRLPKKFTFSSKEIETKKWPGK